jgi:uncharacterized protein YbjQ (UPF0145 family)
MTSESPYRGSAPAPSRQIVVTTGQDVPGFRITHVLAVVTGLALRTKETGGYAAARSVREAAVGRLLEEARGLGANAIIGMRFDSTGDEVCAYGTAVAIGG